MWSGHYCWQIERVVVGRALALSSQSLDSDNGAATISDGEKNNDLDSRYSDE